MPIKRPIAITLATIALLQPLTATAATVEAPSSQMSQAIMATDQTVLRWQANPDAPDSTPSGAWAWGILLPGLGQIAVGEPGRGLLTMGSAAALPMAGALLGTALGAGQGFPPMLTGFWLGVAGSIGLWIWGITDAYQIEQAKRDRP